MTLSFFQNYKALPATYNGEEPPGHEEQQGLKQLYIKPGNWKGVSLTPSSLPTTLIVANV